MLLAIISVQRDDITYDETDHLQYGIALLKGNSSRDVPGRDYGSTMPVTALNALPRAVEQVFHKDLHKTDWGVSDVKMGRYVTIAVTLLLLVYIYLFATALGGKTAGCWAMFLAAVDPNILAHSRLVTTDLYGTLGFVMTLYHLHQWLVAKKSRHFYYWCMAIAFAQCCKINNILLYAVCLAAIIGYWRSAYPSGNKYRWAKHLLLFVFIQLLVINSLFFFRGFGTAYQDYPSQSEFFENFATGFWGKIPLPFPQPFIETFDKVQYERETFNGTALNYLLGELRYKQGFKNYYLICWALKTPLLIQLLLLVTIVYCIVRDKLRKQFIFFYVIPIVIVLALLNTSSIQSGYRYLLPVTALSIVFIGASIAPVFANRLKPVRWGLIAIPLVVVFFASPNFIAYTNEIVLPKKNAYRYLADSNLHWGQRSEKIKQFLAQHPDYIFEPSSPVKGTIVVELNALTGIIRTKEFEWLRTQYKPVATFDDCYLIFEVK